MPTGKNKMPSSGVLKSSVRPRHTLRGESPAIPELAFRKMRGMRNIVAHDYANVDLRIVWEVATGNLRCPREVF
jgi:uncharacterized protein with HEPN domain